MERVVITGERNRGESEHYAEQNEPDQRESQQPVENYEHKQRSGINEDENHEENLFIEQNEMHPPGSSHSKFFNKKNFNDNQALVRRKMRDGVMVNRSIGDNQRRENNVDDHLRIQ